MIKLGNLDQYFNPQTVKTFSSPYNKKIELVKFSGRLRLDINDLTQSGSVIEKIWSKGFDKLLPDKFPAEKILLLGLGAGSVLKPIRQHWPRAQVTAIEIDPLIIKIARDYFDVKETDQLKIIEADALDFVDSLGESFDLCLVDCYLGDQFPQALETSRFYQKLLSHCSHVLVNRIFWGEYQQPALDFKEKLAQQFKVNSTRTPSNLLLHLS